eukprot:1016795-Pelagomonas_calceolata.AAC.5
MAPLTPSWESRSFAVTTTSSLRTCNWLGLGMCLRSEDTIRELQAQQKQDLRATSKAAANSHFTFAGSIGQDNPQELALHSLVEHHQCQLHLDGGKRWKGTYLIQCFTLHQIPVCARHMA